MNFTETVREQQAVQTKILEQQNAAIEKFEEALFGTAEQKGLVVIAGKIDNHIDVFCNVAKWSYRLVLAVVVVVAPIVAIGHNLGWW